MDPVIETALNDLDRSTSALLKAEMDNAVSITPLLERRLDAIKRIASLLQSPPQSAPAVLARLSSALEGGSEATRRARRCQFEAREDWTRLHQVLQTLRNGRGAASHEIDISG